MIQASLRNKFSSICSNADSDYDLEVSCEDQTNECRELICHVDYAFAHKMDNQEVDFSEPTNQAECSFDFQVPQNNLGLGTTRTVTPSHPRTTHGKYMAARPQQQQDNP